MKKRNLFIMHTQYNLILATGIMKSKYKNDINDLIVFAEFEVTGDWERKLKQVYSNVWFVRKRFETYKGGMQDIILLKKQIKSCKEFIRNHYDQVLVAQDRPFENVIVRKIKKRNPYCVCSAVEEDVYFSLNKRHANIFATVKRAIKSLMIKALYGVWCGAQQFYGNSKYIDRVYVCYPNSVRSELKKETISIDKEIIERGIHNLYPCGKREANQKFTVLIASDLMSRYKDQQKISDVFNLIVEWCSKRDIRLLMKYHPRETNPLNLCGDMAELPSDTAIEKYFMELQPDQTVIIGNLSTSLEMANKMGFRVLSIVHICGGNEEAEQVYKDWGISVPETPNDIIQSLERAMQFR